MVITRKNKEIEKGKKNCFDLPGLPFPEKEIIESDVSNVFKSSA